MTMYDIIMKKRRGMELSDEEIAFFISGYVSGSIPDYQASALCMAICFQGMSDREIATLTDVMAKSGDMMDLSAFGNLSVDKHSTGGVGDKTSLIVCPIVASLGGKVAKMSGRGLGHTGGTIDKLESVPGLTTSLSDERFLSQAKDIGIVIAGQTKNLAPADKKLYALRDVTATVDSIPLITASIMSKKLAGGAKNLVLDVKTGSGAFMKSYDDALCLARCMVNIGKSCGRNTTAVLTDMDRPLGRAVGNTLEVIEAIEVLQGKRKDDLYEVCITLATEMIILLKNISRSEARTMAEESIADGSAFAKMKEWIAAQGGDIQYIEDTSKFPKASRVIPVISDKDGYISLMNTEAIGSVAVTLGAGRTKIGDEIDYSAGIIIEKKTGDYVKQGDTIAYLYTNYNTESESLTEAYISALCISDTPVAHSKLIYEIIR